MQNRVPLRLSATAFLIPLAMVFAANGAAFVGNVVEFQNRREHPFPRLHSIRVRRMAFSEVHVSERLGGLLQERAR